MYKWLLLLGLAPACAPTPCQNSTCVETQAPDTRAVWSFLGGEGAAPRVHLYSVGDCDSGRRIMDGRDCLYGVTYNEVYVAPLDWRVTIAHEYLHVVLGQDYGDRDADHLRPEWKGSIQKDAATLLP